MVRDSDKIKMRLLAYYNLNDFPIQEKISSNEIEIIRKKGNVKSDEFLIDIFASTGDNLIVTSTKNIYLFNRQFLLKDKLSFMEIKAIYLNPKFKQSDLGNQLHVIYKNTDYIFQFDNLETLSKIRTDLHKLISTVLINWVGHDSLNKIDTEILLIKKIN